LSFQAFKTGTIFDFILIIGCICFALGAVLRLARFNIIEDPGYTGVPTPVSCLLMIGFFYINYFHAFAIGGLTYPFLAVTYYSVPFLLVFIGWLNITTHIKFGEKGKIVYYVFIFLAPLSPIFGIIGILNPNFIVSMTVAIIFLILFLILFTWTLFHSFLLNFLAKNKKTKLD
ncbi:MAG: hypothetical protein ACTSQR_00255, partial [Promethearchaeota archaeon]